MAAYSPDPAAADAAQPKPRRNRVVVLGAAAAVVLGLVIGAIALTSHRPAKPAGAPTAATATAAHYKPIPGDYHPLDPQQVASAFADGQRLYAGQGLSGLANASMRCFERLGREPSYGLMDYCLALDVYGAQTYSAVAGDEAPSSTWFGQGPVRRLAAVQALTAGATDANARMLDTSRAIQAVAAAATPAPPPQPAPVVVATTTTPPPAPVVNERAAPPPPPASPPQPQATPARTALPLPARQPQPPLARPAEPPRMVNGPSFNCRYARSVTERMICGEPELAAADRRLAAAFNRAMAESPDPSALRRQQDRWLAARERAGADYDAVLDLYEIRTRELREEP